MIEAVPATTDHGAADVTSTSSPLGSIAKALKRRVTVAGLSSISGAMAIDWRPAA
jgi:hypothetical protein